MNSTEQLDAAYLIGLDICREAVWHGDCCNWVGALQDRGPGGQPSIIYAALGPDLYGGTSGVAIFLAHLYALTSDRQILRTAVGAIGQAVSHLESIPPSQSAGFYTGRLGVRLAAAWVARVLRDETPFPDAGVVGALTPSGTEFDLLGGTAGGVVACLVLAELLDDRSWVDLAVRHGDRLISMAKKKGDWLAWVPTDAPRSKPLTGFSHGAAGAGYALIELYGATGEAHYGEAAYKAFRYEATLYHPEVKNWPDLRSRGPGQVRAGPKFATYWCHGAPGIALSRIRALEVGWEGVHLVREIGEAAETTARMVEASLVTGSANLSLCHGLAGNSEVLVEADAALPDRAEIGTKLALRVAEYGVDNFLTRGVALPCGTYEGVTPSLFLGLAGIGLFYLRLHDPNIPSVLMPRPETFRATQSQWS